MARVLHPFLLGRFGLPRLPAGAVAHIKYPIVISDRAFREATGFQHRFAEYETLGAFLDASPPPSTGVSGEAIPIATPGARG